MNEIVGPFSSKQIEKIYKGLMSKEFYDENYNATSWNPAPYELMKNILVSVFDLRKGHSVTDLGSGAGYLVLAMKAHGIKARGVEFSAAMLKRIGKKDLKNFVLAGTIEDVDFSGSELVTCLEVFEHLPLSLTVHNLSYLRTNLSGEMFLTIPSSGKDQTNPNLGITESHPLRLTAMQDNVFCNHLWMIDGEPGGGHIILAGYRWWEDFFLTQGFVRVTDRELKLEAVSRQLAAYVWCPYVLRPMQLDEVWLGRGWHGAEGSGEHRWNGPNAELTVISERAEFDIEFPLVLPNPNIMVERWVTFEVEQLDLVDDYRVETTLIQLKKVSLQRRGPSETLRLRVRRDDSAQASEQLVEDGAIKPFRAYRIRLHTPLWTPKLSGLNDDDRLLGMQFGKMQVVEPSD